MLLYCLPSKIRFIHKKYQPPWQAAETQIHKSSLILLKTPSFICITLEAILTRSGLCVAINTVTHKIHSTRSSDDVLADYLCLLCVIIRPVFTDILAQLIQKGKSLLPVTATVQGMNGGYLII